jgi:small neutral amino acid transporter SnatA (MarC family)
MNSNRRHAQDSAAVVAAAAQSEALQVLVEACAAPVDYPLTAGPTALATSICSVARAVFGLSSAHMYLVNSSNSTVELVRTGSARDSEVGNLKSEHL